MIEIEGIGSFFPEYMRGEKAPMYYTCTVDGTDVVIYPKEDGSPYTDDDKRYVRRRYDQFVESARESILAGFDQVRQLCDQYGIEVPDRPASELVSELKLTNCKIGLQGWLECYTEYGVIAESLDLVVTFDESMTLTRVYFDG